ncbi:ankyrin repeat domain-containing protein [Methylomonas montana]|uniref:ankyrin repeat domain-containing protein n=1 Tax=Methylomonas montana TaxID=3058963 RepID=UPI002658B21B|nr:ankyrin repeat domain-containing protein [Methylomonas montana]WKJ88686.1 ankyrin repeat domain-containing protein [Methylomonas montana]
MATPTIFISYRREDSAGHAGRIYDRFVESFGKNRVFRDVDGIATGEDFVEAIREKIKQSDVLLALIGPRWLTAVDEEGHWRLANENDWVRVEIVAALERNMRVIPVLLQDTPIPKADNLPGAIAKLAQRNAFEIRDNHFDLDVSLLIDKLRPSWRNKLARIFSRWPAYAVLSLLLLSALGFWLYPQLVFTPEKSRAQIVQMGMQFDANTFVERAKANDVQAVEMFLRAGMSADAENDENQSALKVAAAHGHFDLVKLLIDKGADVVKAISWAAAYGQKQILDYMLERNSDQAAINNALFGAVGTEYTDTVQLLLDKGADANAVDQDSGISVLIDAVDGNEQHTEQVKLLLSKGADVNLKGDETQPSALFVAAGKFNAELVDLLLAQGADVNVKDKSDATPLHQAVSASNSGGEENEQQRLKIVRSLLDKGADLTGRAKWMEAWQPTPLAAALHADTPQVALLLIEAGADVNDRTGDTGGSFSLTALMHAADKGMTDVIKALLAKEAEVNVRNEEGESALLLAAASPRGDEIVPILLANGADAGVANNEGRTVLMKAARSNWYLGDQVIQALVEHGAKLDATDSNGWTALMHTAASRYQRLDVAKQLLKLGADKTPVNDEGDNALAIANKEGNKKIAALLNTR